MPLSSWHVVAVLVESLNGKKLERLGTYFVDYVLAFGPFL